MILRGSSYADAAMSHITPEVFTISTAAQLIITASKWDKGWISTCIVSCWPVRYAVHDVFSLLDTGRLKLLLSLNAGAPLPFVTPGVPPRPQYCIAIHLNYTAIRMIRQSQSQRRSTVLPTHTSKATIIT